MTPFVPLKSKYPFYLANEPQMGDAFLPVIDKYSQKPIAEVALASPAVIAKAIEAAQKAEPLLRRTSVFERKRILKHCIDQFQSRHEELSRVLCLEVGKCIKDARNEVGRLIDTFTFALEEAGKLYGEVLPLDNSNRGSGYQGFWKRVPIGLCSFISPFNFPLNLTAHKIAPALAVGCPFVLKPASKTPITSLVIGEILAESGLPPGAFSILPCPRDGADLFCTDERFKLLSFTGSPEVGWDLKSRSGKKKVVLELGGNAACIVDQSAQLTDTVRRILVGAFSQSGQSCISVQRILVHESIYQEFKSLLVSETKKLKVGDPKDDKTDIGPLISEQETIRLEKWIEKAKSGGATILCGGKRTGAVLEPTILEDVPNQEPISCEEAFGPVATLSSFKVFEEAIQATNQSRFGLQAGLFTQSLSQVLYAWDNLEVGGVCINEVPSWRSDTMPYGGVKDSGIGREGVRFAMEEMTEIRALVIRDVVNNSPK